MAASQLLRRLSSKQGLISKLGLLSNGPSARCGEVIKSAAAESGPLRRLASTSAFAGGRAQLGSQQQQGARRVIAISARTYTLLQDPAASERHRRNVSCERLQRYDKF